MTTRKIKVKVTKKKINIKKIIATIILLLTLILSVVYFAHLPVKNIYVTGNKYIKDKEIISIAKLDNSPPYVNTYFMNIKEELLKNDYIKSVKIKRRLPCKIYIEIEEYKPIAIYNDEIILSSKNKIKNTNEVEYLPYITNNIDEIYNNFVEKFSIINDDILLKISHIEYSPNEVDKERFLLYMVDNNYVYITLSKIEKLNKYNLIVNELDDKKGIIYLDSGDYLEIKD